MLVKFLNTIFYPVLISCVANRSTPPARETSVLQAYRGAGIWGVGGYGGGQKTPPPTDPRTGDNAAIRPLTAKGSARCPPPPDIPESTPNMYQT